MLDLKAGHPGKTLALEIKSRDLSVKAASRNMDISDSFIYLIIKGKKNITKNVAEKLGKIGIGTESFWLKLQSNYNERISNNERA